MDFNEGAFIYINKPYGMSSFGALAHIRFLISKKMHVKRVKTGHAGTLDPLATGVLILCTGKATKQIETLQLHDKEYTATLQLGATTPSFDREHTVDMTYPTRHITRELIQSVLANFVGDIQQVPPAYSAVMVDGHRAYKLARKGGEVELKAKPVRIDELEQGHLHPLLGPRHRLRLGQRCLPDGALPHPPRRRPHRGLPDLRQLSPMARPATAHNAITS